MTTQSQTSDLRTIATKELAVLAGFLFLGLVLLPALVYVVGQNVFGSYGGDGYGDFFGRLAGKLRGGDFAAWFLALAPYLGWQCLRLTAFAWRAIGRLQHSA